MADAREPRAVSRRALLAGLGGGAALTATTAVAPTTSATAATAAAPTAAAVVPTAATTADPASPAGVVATGLGKKQLPQWTTERSIESRTPGHAQWIAEPGLDGGSLWLGDSTFEYNRIPFQYAVELAERNPRIRIVYDKAGWGGGPDGGLPFPTSMFAPFRAGDQSGAYSQIFNATSWQQAGGVDQHQPIPGLPNFSMKLPPAPKYTPWGATDPGSPLTKGAVGVDIKPATWRSVNAQVLLTQDDPTKADGRGTVLRLRPDGKVELRLAADANGAKTLVAVTTQAVTDYVSDGERCAVLFEFELDKNGKAVFTPWYRTGGHGSKWTALGLPITKAKQTGVWQGNPLVPWEFGAGASFKGDFYEAIVRKVDKAGPDLIPRLPQQWTPATPNMRGTMVGGRTYWMTVLAWPQHGLLDFAARTDMPATSAIFTRTWNKDPASAANVVSPLDMVPQLPYLMTVLNSGHNETGTGSMNGDLLRSVHDKLAARTVDAEHCVLVQNATLRDDTSQYLRDGQFVFDQTNTTGNRRSHDWRIAQYAAVARTMGCQVLDARSDMVDYVRAGGNLADLLQTTGEKLHPNMRGAELIAGGLLNQTTTTDFGTTVVLP